MSMINWYRYCLRHYFTFRGRASRREYWSFTLINMVILLIFWLISSKVDVPVEEAQQNAQSLPQDPATALFFGSLYLLFSMFIFFPSLSVTIRRLHDRNHNGFWVVAQFIPLLNFVLFVFLVLPSSPYANEYGLRAPQTPDDKVPDIMPNFYNPYQGAAPNGFPTASEPAATSTAAQASCAAGAEGATSASKSSHESATAEPVSSRAEKIEYEKPDDSQPQGAPTVKTTQNIRKGSALDELMREDLPNADVQAGIEPEQDNPPKTEGKENKNAHRPMKGDESALVSFLNQLSK